MDFHELSFLPGGRDLLYTVHLDGGRSRVGVLAKGKRKILLEFKGHWTWTPVYSSAGFLLYGEQPLSQEQSPQNNIWAVPFSPAKLSVTGAPFLVAGNAMRPSLSHDGTLIYEQPVPPQRSQLVWVSRKGNIEATIGQPQQGLRYPALSPDAKRVAVDGLGQGGNENIWIYDVARGVRTALLSSPGEEFNFTPAWTHDGSQIVFGAFKDISTSIWLQAADGSGNAQKLLEGMWLPQPSPRGDYLSFVSTPGPGALRIC